MTKEKHHSINYSMSFFSAVGSCYADRSMQEANNKLNYERIPMETNKETTAGDEAPAEKTPEITLSEALKIVNQAIRKREDSLRKYITDNSTSEETIIVYGVTYAGCRCTIEADASKIAKIMLDYDEPTFNILGEDCPDDMWSELASATGIKTVCEVDI